MTESQQQPAESLTRQQVFTKIVLHLRAQGKKSKLHNEDESDEYCAYRGEDDTACAAGCLILDQFYNPDLEGAIIFATQERAARSLAVRQALTLSGVQESDLVFVSVLQRVHDCWDPCHWERELALIAESDKLEMPSFQQK